MKYLIPCAGLGTRLSPITDKIPKELVPINGKPVIWYTIDLINKTDKKAKICIVLSPKKNTVKRYLLSAFPKNNFVFVIQKKPIGLANAVYQAKKFVNGSTFLLMFPDHFQLDTKLLSYFVNSKYPLILAQKENEKNSLKYGVIFLNKNKTISKIIEKPKFLPKGFYLCSQCYYLLPNSIFDAIKNIKTEYLQDAINLTIKDGEKYFVYDKKYKSYDMGTLKGLEKTQREIKKI